MLCGAGEEAAVACVLAAISLRFVLKNSPYICATDIQVDLNDLLKPVGLENNGAAAVDATENWWGCPAGPNRPGCSTITGSGSVLFQPWLTRPNQSSEHHDGHDQED